MRRILILIVAAAVAVSLVGCARSVAIDRTDGAPDGASFDGAAAAGGEPMVTWGPTHDSFYVTVIATGICVGVPTKVTAESSNRIVVRFANSITAACPPDKTTAWQLATPGGVDDAGTVHVTLALPDDGSLSNHGVFDWYELDP